MPTKSMQCLVILNHNQTIRDIIMTTVFGKFAPTFNLFLNRIMRKLTPQWGRGLTISIGLLYWVLQNFWCKLHLLQKISKKNCNKFFVFAIVCLITLQNWIPFYCRFIMHSTYLKFGTLVKVFKIITFCFWKKKFVIGNKIKMKENEILEEHFLVHRCLSVFNVEQWNVYRWNPNIV